MSHKIVASEAGSRYGGIRKTRSFLRPLKLQYPLTRFELLFAWRNGSHQQVPKVCSQEWPVIVLTAVHLKTILLSSPVSLWGSFWMWQRRNRAKSSAKTKKVVCLTPSGAWTLKTHHSFVSCCQHPVRKNGSIKKKLYWNAIGTIEIFGKKKFKIWCHMLGYNDSWG